MRKKRTIFLIVGLIFCSFVLLLSGVIYYDLSYQVKNYHYVNREEYDDVQKGISFIQKLPIQLNILNHSFADMNLLKVEDQEQILLSYVMKNKQDIAPCMNEMDTSDYKCLSLDELQDTSLQSLFGLDLTFETEKIDLYSEVYGSQELVKTDDCYRFQVGYSDNEGLENYSYFVKYKQEGDNYLYYFYQGYYNSTCDAKNGYQLTNYIDGEVVEQEECTVTQPFSNLSSSKREKLQLYKYILRKDENGKFYLYGYNPVKNIDAE